MPLLDENQWHNYGGGHVRGPIESLKKSSQPLCIPGPSMGVVPPPPIRVTQACLFPSRAGHHALALSLTLAVYNYQRTKFYVHGGLMTVTVSS